MVGLLLPPQASFFNACSNWSLRAGSALWPLSRITVSNSSWLDWAADWTLFSHSEVTTVPNSPV
ncbi:hypothetical protein VK98_21240 [Chromobacterium sp. LK11]|nr:hypothetical protein VK98_21240 [Chromobacterium sp. LK11]